MLTFGTSALWVSGRFSASLLYYTNASMLAWLLRGLLHCLLLRGIRADSWSSMQEPHPTIAPPPQSRQERSPSSNSRQTRIRRPRYNCRSGVHELRCHAFHASVDRGFTGGLASCWLVRTCPRVWWACALLCGRFALFEGRAG